MADFDPREFERRLQRLELQIEQLMEAVRRREEDFSVVRTNAGKVPDLLEQMRELKRTMGRGDDRVATAAPTPAPVAQTSAPVDVRQVVKGVAEQLLAKGQLPTVDDLKRIVKEEIGTQLRALVNVEQLTERIWKEITATGVEERLAKLLLDRVGKEVDSKQVIRQLVEEILSRLNVESLTKPVTDGVVEKLASQLQLTRKSSY